MEDKIKNLLLEIASMIETGSIPVGVLGLSQESVDYLNEIIV